MIEKTNRVAVRGTSSTLKVNALPRRVASVALAAVLAFGLMPVPAFAAEASAEPDAPTATAQRAQRSEQEIDAAVSSLIGAGDYVEGEAIVCLLGDTDERGASLSAQSEGDGSALLAGAEMLSGVTARQYAEATGEAIPTSAANDLTTQAADEEVSVALVRKDGMSTEQLLRELLGDARVLSAEPNYIMDIGALDEVGGKADALTADGTAGTALTGGQAQLGAQASGEGATGTTGAPGATGTTGAPGATGTTGAPGAPGAPGTASAPGTAGATFNTPDLTGYQWFSDGAESFTSQLLDAKNPGVRSPHWNQQGEKNAEGVVVVMDSGVDYTHPDLVGVMHHFTPEQQEALGCGEFGYAPAREDVTDPMDYLNHGTHCAGVIAAEWNGFGVSGIASGVEICAISIARSTTDSTFTYDSIVKAYDFMIRAARAGVDIRAVNRSLSSDPTNNANQAMMQAAGEMGIVTCVASGNEGYDYDSLPSDIATSQQNPYVVRVDASALQDERAWFSNYGKYTTDLFAPGVGILSTVPSTSETMSRYFPEADPDKRYFETSFDGTLPDITGEEYTPLSELTRASIGVDGDGKSVKTDTRAQVQSNCTLLIDIPVGDVKVADVQDISLAMYAQGVFLRFGSLGALLEDGTYTSGPEYARSEAVANLSDSSPNGWAFCRMHVSDASKLGKEFKTVTDSKGRTCIRVRASSQIFTKDGKPGDDVDFTLHIDQIAVGNPGNSGFIPYAYMNGTSMATPCVAGCTAIVSSAMSGVDADVRAASTVRMLKGALRQAPGYTGFCKQNGQVDLSRLGTPDTYAPVLESAQVAANTVTVRGAYLGSAGTCSIGGVSVPASSWSPTAITMTWPASVKSGLVPITVKTGAGAEACRAFMLQAPETASGGVALYERELSSPVKSAEEAIVAGCPTSVAASEDGSLFAAVPTLEGDPFPSAHDLLRSNDRGTTWTAYPLPQPMKNVQLVSGADTLFVLGETPVNDPTAVNFRHLYSFDASKGTFAYLASFDAFGEELPYEGALAFANGNLFYVDNIGSSLYGQSSSHMRIRRFSADYKTLVDAVSLRHEYLPAGYAGGIKAVTVGNSIYVGGFERDDTGYTAGSACGLERLDVDADGSFAETDISAALGNAKLIDPQNICMAASEHGVYLIGAELDALLPAGANRTDTFFLKSSATTFEPYAKTFSFAPVSLPASVCADNWLYAFGVSDYEATPLIGRATALPVEPTPTPAPVPGIGESVVAGNYIFTVTSKDSLSVKLSPAGKKSLVTAKIPATKKLSGKTFKVASIDAEGFASAKKLARVSIGANVKTIGSKAFYRCTKLAKVTGGTSVTDIGIWAFAGCAKTKAFAVGSKRLKTIGDSAFRNCKKLKKLSIANTTALTKAGVKGSLAGSNVKKVVVKKSKRAAYQKFFTLKNCGKKVAVV